MFINEQRVRERIAEKKKEMEGHRKSLDTLYFEIDLMERMLSSLSSQKKVKVEIQYSRAEKIQLIKDFLEKKGPASPTDICAAVTLNVKSNYSTIYSILVNERSHFGRNEKRKWFAK